MDSVYLTPEQIAGIDPTERVLAVTARLKAGGLSQCRQGLVYFIQAASGPVKIGRAKCAHQRLAELQIANHEVLTLRAVAVGGRVAERGYHRQFASHRIHGEWFHPHLDILAEIERLTVAATPAGGINCDR